MPYRNIPTDSPADLRRRNLLPIDEVLTRLGIRRTFLYALIKMGKFPAPFKIGKVSRWAESDISTFIHTLKKTRE